MSGNDQETRELPDAVIAALTNGRKIEAIKILRGEWDMDLKDAKGAVDQYLSSRNSSQALRRAPTTEAGTGRMLWFVLVVIVVFIAYYMLTKS